jgi:hypothetical protein
MRIIGRPHDLVRPDIVGQHGKAAIDRLEEIQQLRWKSSLGRVFRPEA